MVGERVVESQNDENSRHHYDHSGGLRAFTDEGVTIVTHERNRAFFERTLATAATIERIVPFSALARAIGRTP